MASRRLPVRAAGSPALRFHLVRSAMWRGRRNVFGGRRLRESRGGLARGVWFFRNVGSRAVGGLDGPWPGNSPKFYPLAALRFVNTDRWRCSDSLARAKGLAFRLLYTLPIERDTRRDNNTRHTTRTTPERPP